MSPLNQTTTARAQKPDDLQTKSAKLPIKIDQRGCRATDAAACVKMCIQFGDRKREGHHQGCRATDVYDLANDFSLYNDSDPRYRESRALHGDRIKLPLLGLPDGLLIGGA